MKKKTLRITVGDNPVSMRVAYPGVEQVGRHIWPAGSVLEVEVETEFSATALLVVEMISEQSEDIARGIDNPNRPPPAPPEAHRGSRAVGG